MQFKKNYHKAHRCNLQATTQKISGYARTQYVAPKSLRFILRMLREKCEVRLYIPRSNKISKYVFVSKDDRIFKIRFSNHKPIVQKELDNDCDFYAGISNLKTMTTEAIAKIILGIK